MKWRTSKGEIIDIRDMDNSHLQNCVNMLQRQLDCEPDWDYPSGDDSDGAYWAGVCEARRNQQLHDDLTSAIRQLKKEQNQRKNIILTNNL